MVTYDIHDHQQIIFKTADKIYQLWIWSYDFNYAHWFGLMNNGTYMYTNKMYVYYFAYNNLHYAVENWKVT